MTPPIPVSLCTDLINIYSAVSLSVSMLISSLWSGLVLVLGGGQFLSQSDIISNVFLCQPELSQSSASPTSCLCLPAQTETGPVTVSAQSAMASLEYAVINQTPTFASPDHI